MRAKDIRAMLPIWLHEINLVNTDLGLAKLYFLSASEAYWQKKWWTVFNSVFSHEVQQYRVSVIQVCQKHLRRNILQIINEKIELQLLTIGVVAVD